MSRWKEQFDGHPIHETLNELKKLVNTDFEDIDEQEIAERRRFDKILSAYRKCLENVDAEIVPFNQLDSLNSSLRNANIFNEATNYSSNGKVAHLTSANDHLSAQLTPLSLLLAFGEKASSSENLADLEKNIDYATNALTSKKAELEQELEKLKSAIDVGKQNLAKLEANIEARRTETDGQLSTWQQQFSEAQERRSTEYTAWREKVDEKTDTAVSALVEKSKEALSKHQEDFESRIGEIESDAKTKHQAILDLYELVAGDSVGAGYLKSAEDEKGLANIWRRVAIGFIVVTVGWLFYAYCQQAPVGTEGGILWSKLMATVSLTGVLLFGAAYSSQQSNRHRANEKRTRWFALQVKAIDPFINSLGEDDRNQLKRLLSERLFGNHDEASEKGGAVIEEHALNVVVKSITDILAKVPK